MTDEIKKRLVNEFAFNLDKFSSNERMNNGIPLTVVSVFYDNGVNELRKQATKKAIRFWTRQKHIPDEILFVELGYNGVFTFEQKDFPRQIKYVRIYGDDSHKYLFQKECIWNQVAKIAKHDRLMFIDSDIAPTKDVDWFKKSYDILDKALFAQGFNHLTYLGHDDRKQLSVLSYASQKANCQSSSERAAPGGVYCISKNTLDAIGGFNFLPFGGGDDLFLYETIGKPTDHVCIKLVAREGTKEKFSDMAKKQKKKAITYVKVDVCHFFHGDVKNRSRGQRHMMVLTQYPWLGSVIEKD